MITGTAIAVGRSPAEIIEQAAYRDCHDGVGTHRRANASRTASPQASWQTDTPRRPPKPRLIDPLFERTTEDANIKSARVRSHARWCPAETMKVSSPYLQFKSDAKRLVPVSATEASPHRRCHAWNIRIFQMRKSRSLSPLKNSAQSERMAST